MMKSLTLISLSAIAVFLLAGCKCPFCCCHKETTPTKTVDQTQPQQTAPVNQASTPTATAPLLISTKDQFDKEVLQEKLPVIVDLSAEWCGACKASKPTFEATAQQLGSNYKFVIVDVDKVEQVAQELGVQGIPTFVFFKNGKEVNRITGAVTKKEEFIATIEKTFAK